jgi:hypothetical protein
MLHPIVMQFFQSPSPRGDATIDYIAELTLINGGHSEVTEFNIVKPADNRFGRLGLNVEEAFHLTQLVNFLKGILYALAASPRGAEHEAEVYHYVATAVERARTGTRLYFPTGPEIGRFGS